MARLNLLPWREELRKQRQKDFAQAALAACGLVALVMLGIHMQISGMIDAQNARNQYLQSEITILDAKIKEIKDLESKKSLLISKMDVIQTLQVSRPEIVHLFEELAKTVPEGVYIDKLEQKGRNLALNGVAQSNARVSAYMRNLDKSPWLKGARLNIIETSSKSKYERMSRFTLNVMQSTPKSNIKDESL